MLNYFCCRIYVNFHDYRDVMGAIRIDYSVSKPQMSLMLLRSLKVLILKSKMGLDDLSAFILKPFAEELGPAWADIF